MKDAFIVSAVRTAVGKAPNGALRSTQRHVLPGAPKAATSFHSNGIVTAGNSSQTSDGAAVAVVVSEEVAVSLALKPLARFVAFATSGCLPEEMGIGPVYAIPKALKLAGLTLEQIDVIELNEAFAAQSLAVMKLLQMDPAKVNVNGGAIALGHPLGCTGAKLTATILRELKRRKKEIWIGDDVRRRRNGRSWNF
ncbi:MAG: thiolase family protein [Acidobacteriaceae bacterium]